VIPGHHRNAIARDAGGVQRTRGGCRARRVIEESEDEAVRHFDIVCRCHSMRL
jgi:hypothetical protein